MFYENMPLYLKLVYLLKTEYTIVGNLPKAYKFSLGQDIITRSWELIDVFMAAQLSNPLQASKKSTLQEMSLCFEKLKLRIRFLSELKLISLKQATALNEMVVEIGKMIGSWLKNV